MTKRKLFRGRYKTIMGYVTLKDDNTQEKISFTKPCRTPHSFECLEEERSPSCNSPPSDNNQVSKFYQRYGERWEYQKQEMLG